MGGEGCTLCPRTCHADRTARIGRCGGGAMLRIARAALHFWEEPCISGTRGSGTVFFSGCTLGCCFCQNYQISAENFGEKISVQRLSEIFLELQKQGAHNINLINPIHYTPWVIEALAQIKPQLKIPVVCNCGGYERVETLKMLEGWVDIYLPDLKFFSSDLSKRYSGAADYFNIAKQAIPEMVRQVGVPQYDADGILKKGVIVRHLVLPKAWRDSIALFTWLFETFQKEEILISLMSQYTPFYHSDQFPELTRRISTYEYQKVLDFVQASGFEGFRQERSSAKEEYTPDFDLTGV